jgi:hypothetical protein
LRTLCLSSSSSSRSGNSSSFKPRSQQQQSAPQGNKVHRKSEGGARELAQHQVVRGMEGQRNACNCCGRRNLITSFGGALLSGAGNEQDSQAVDVDYVNAKVSILFSLPDFLFLSFFFFAKGSINLLHLN